jgi:hypothetical protein
MWSGYDAVRILARERPGWLPIIEASLRCAKQYNKFAGKWVLEELNKSGWLGFRSGSKSVKWFPGLRTLVAYGILNREGTAKGGRGAYYSVPDPEGVEKALRELGFLKKSHP